MRRILLLIIILVVGTLVLKNVLVANIIVKAVKSMTGLQVYLGKADLGITKTYFGLSDLKVLNPSGFNDEVMADLPRISADYDLGAFLKGNIHLQQLTVELKQLLVEVNNQGKANINSLKALVPKGGGKPPPKIQIDILRLKVEKVLFKNYAAGAQQEREINVDLEEEFKDITNPDSLVSLIVFKALSKTDIAGMANIDLSGLKQNALNQLGGRAESLGQQLKEQTKENLNKAKQGLENIFNQQK